MAKNDTLGPIEETVDEEVLKLRLASVAVPRFRDQKRRRLRTDTGREIDTSILAEALLKRADIELAIREEVARRYCLDCKKLLKSIGVRRCQPCSRKHKNKNFGIKCDCGNLIPTKIVSYHRGRKGTNCELRCSECTRAPKCRTNKQCVCGATISPDTVYRQRQRYGYNCILQCMKCSRGKFRKNYGFECNECKKPLTPISVSSQRHSKGKDCILRCRQCYYRSRKKVQENTTC